MNKPTSIHGGLRHCYAGALLLGALSASGQTATNDKENATTSDDKAITLDTVVVSGFSTSLAKSLEVKRERDTIVDIVTAEDVGKFPDMNVAESLSHLTGISVDHVFGEGEMVSILGTDPALNRALVNGQTIASGQWGGSTNDSSGRTFNYTLLSPEIIGTLEVYKATEARIDDGSIGGTVIINTRRPLDLPNNTVRASLGYAYNDRSEKGNARGSILYSWKSADKKFGALVALTHDKEYLNRAGIEYWGFGTVGTNAYKVPFGMNAAFFKQTRQRDGIQAALQWKPTDEWNLNLTGIHIKGVYDNFSQSRYVVPAYWGTLDSYDVKGDYVVGGHVTAGNATVNGQVLVGPAANPYNANGQYDTNLRKSTVTTDSIHLRGDNDRGDWHSSFDIGHTDAKGGKDPEYLFSMMFNQSYTFSYDGSKSSLTFDDPNAALATSTYKTRRVGDQAGGIYYAKSDDREDYGQLDFARRLNWGKFTKLRFGAKVSSHENSQDARGNRIDVTEIKDLSAFSPSNAPSGLFDGVGTSGDMAKMVVPTQDAVVKYLLSLPQGVYNEDKGSEWKVKETNAAVYTQTDFSSKNYRGNLGIRAVHTKDDSTYWNYEGSSGTYTRVTKATDYTKYLPSFNFTLDLADDLLLRTGVSQVVARARYSDLAGQFSLDNKNLTGGGGNPDLKPYESSNVNIALEWYPTKSSIVSAELFARDISNYVLVTTTTLDLLNTDTQKTATYSVSIPKNAGTALVKGVAFNVQQSLGYGFGIAANATLADSETSNGYNMPYLSKTTYNLIPYFEKGKFSARMSYSWRSEFFTQIGRANGRMFSDSYAQLDASASYALSKNVDLVVNASNLLDSTYFAYYMVKYAPMGVYKTGRVLTVNVNYKL